MPLNRTIIVSTHPCSANIRLLLTLVLKLHLSHVSKTRSNDVFVYFRVVFDVRCCRTLLFTMAMTVDVAMVEL